MKNVNFTVLFVESIASRIYLAILKKNGYQPERVVKLNFLPNSKFYRVLKQLLGRRVAGMVFRLRQAHSASKVPRQLRSNLLAAFDLTKRDLNANLSSYSDAPVDVVNVDNINDKTLAKFIVNEKIYAYILEKRASTAISKASTVSESRIIDTAVKPIHPIKPQRTLIVVIGFFIGLVFGIILAFLLNLLNNRIKEENDIRENSSLMLIITIVAKDGEVDMYDCTFLNGRESNGISRVRIIGDKKSKIVARSQMFANDAGIGHVDCMGLLLSKNSSIQAMPELINRNKDASLTHEASVGKISEETLNYLRSRGLTEDEAIDLIVTGFLGGEEPVIIKGRIVPSKLYM